MGMNKRNGEGWLSSTEMVLAERDGSLKGHVKDTDEKEVGRLSVKCNHWYDKRCVVHRCSFAYTTTI